MYIPSGSAVTVTGYSRITPHVSSNPTCLHRFGGVELGREWLLPQALCHLLADKSRNEAEGCSHHWLYLHTNPGLTLTLQSSVSFLCCDTYLCVFISQTLRAAVSAPHRKESTKEVPSTADSFSELGWRGGATAANKTLEAKKFITMLNVPSLSVFLTWRGGQCGSPAERDSCFSTPVSAVHTSLSN